MVDLFDDGLEGALHVAAAFADEAGGVDVAIDARAAGEIEGAGDGVGAVPAQVGGLDVLAIGVMADGAFAAVAGAGVHDASFPLAALKRVFDCAKTLAQNNVCQYQPKAEST